VRLPWSGQAVPDADGEWTTNDSPASGDRGAPLQSVGPLIDPTGSTIERINDSCRVPYTTAPDSALPYEFMVGQGEATVTLRFADITPGDVLEPSFAFKTYGADTETAIPFYNVATEAGGNRQKVDYQTTILVNASGLLTVTILKAFNQGNFGFINAIEVSAPERV